MPFSGDEKKIPLIITRKNNFFKFVMLGVLILTLCVVIIVAFIIRGKNENLINEINREKEERKIMDMLV